MSKRSYFARPPRVTLGKKTKSWSDSAVLGIAQGIFWAPATLLALLVDPAKKIALGVLELVFSLLMFVLTRIAVVTFGLLGRASHSGWGMGNEVRRSRVHSDQS